MGQKATKCFKNNKAKCGTDVAIRVTLPMDLYTTDGETKPQNPKSRVTPKQRACVFFREGETEPESHHSAITNVRTNSASADDKANGVSALSHGATAPWPVWGAQHH